ncbi:MAG: hypothetical protein Q9162_000319 [Coniocarpon cinnabarinum]
MSTTQEAYYLPPWADMSIIAIAGSSGSGKTSLARAIIDALNLPWVLIMSMDSFYKVLNQEQSRQAFRNEYDFDAPDAIDFEVLVDRLKELKEGKMAELPIYSFARHAREEKVQTVYSPHVLILEGIFALHDPRILDMTDLKVFADADADLCLSRRLVRDVRERGRDIEGCIKQWFSFVKPNFHKFVEPQKNVADLIVPRGVENTVAINMIVDHVRKALDHKSYAHQQRLKRLGKVVEQLPLSSQVRVLEQKPQVVGVNTILLDPETPREEFIFYFDRLAAILIEEATARAATFTPTTVTTPVGAEYQGLKNSGVISAISILRGGSVMEPALRRTLPDCLTGRLLIQTNYRTGEPELHFRYLPPSMPEHQQVLLLDPQMSSGGAALMAVRVLVDHGVKQEAIVFVAWFAGENGIRRLTAVFPGIRVIVGRIGRDMEVRWVEQKYLGA